MAGQFLGEQTRVQMINSKPSYPGGETLVEPQLTPPVHGDQVAKPLMGQL